MNRQGAKNAKRRKRKKVKPGLNGKTLFLLIFSLSFLRISLAFLAPWRFISLEILNPSPRKGSLLKGLNGTTHQPARARAGQSYWIDLLSGKKGDPNQIYLPQAAQLPHTYI